MPINFTAEQKKVIELHHENILVSAAAGSGKTAVLVERIIQMISEESHPVDVDRLLIVTFTNAAAAEMRERIGNAIAQALMLHPESEHLQRQSALIHNAQITTIDSFCLFLIRNHFQDIGLDPDFRVADEGEIRLLMQDVLAELLEEQFTEGEESFLHCVECYSTGKKETVLEDSILSLYRFAMSYPWPEDWLQEHQKDYQLHTMEALQAAPFFQYGLHYLGQMLPGLLGQLGACRRICEEPDGPYMYAENIEHTFDQLERALGSKTWEEYRERLGGVLFERLPSKKDDSVSPLKRDEVRSIRDGVKKQLAGLQEQLFNSSDERILQQCGEVSPAAEELLRLTILFKQKFDAAKRDKNMVDFSDMEHMALKILCRRSPQGEVQPTPAALEYRTYFEEIMVDEYQDSNLVQESILASIARDDNRFMVGDVKQSIYRFRLARPELFMEKFHTFSTTEGPNRRIDLHQNFRSRTEIIDGVNAVFEQLMDDSLGGITYDDAAALRLGASYPAPAAPEEVGMELLLREKTEDPQFSALQQEAAMVAARIRELHAQGHVADGSSGKLRPVRYSDMVILLRSASGVDEIFREALQQADIPCFISSRTGYFSASEISLLMQLLRCIDNPLQDIPLFAVMHSVFGAFTDEELAQIRAGRPAGELLWQSVQAAAQTGETAQEGGASQTALSQKCAAFCGWLKKYRDDAVYMPISEMLEHILEENHYLEYVTALPAGSQRRANVLMLLERAGAFEQTSFKGLYHFIRYMDQLEKYDIDYGEAGTLDENADVVRIMTIHKSKGLEFPICFLSATGRNLNRNDSKKPVLTDIDLGIGTDLIDPVLRTRSRTLRKTILGRKIQLDNMAEELRVLYVAMTRAKEKLVITGMVDQKEKLLQVNLPLLSTKEKLLPYDLRSSAGSYLDWIFAACARLDGMKQIWEESGMVSSAAMSFLPCSGFRCSFEEPAGLLEETEKQQKQVINDRKSFIDAIKTHVIDSKMQESMQNRCAFYYPHENLQNLYAKTTVSELKIAGMEKLMEKQQEETGKPLFETEQVLPYLPAFLQQEEKVTGAMRGSSMHRFLELLDFTGDLTAEGLEVQLAGMTAAGRLPKEYAELVDRKKILLFLESDLAVRMKKAAAAGKLHREQPFMLGVPADRLGQEYPAQELVLVQGIIDVYLEEDAQLLLADYKTDVIQKGQDLIDRYRVQLDYYAEALERITGMPVAKRVLYSFCLGEEVVVSRSASAGHTICSG